MDFEINNVSKTIIGATLVTILMCSFAIPMLLSIGDAGEQSGDFYSFTPSWSQGFEPVTVTTESLPSFLTWDGTAVSGTLESGTYSYAIVGIDEEGNTQRIVKNLNISEGHASLLRFIFIIPTILIIGIGLIILRRSGFSPSISFSRR